MPAELTQFPASQRVGGRRAALEAVDVQFAPVEVDLLPLQIGYFRSAQAVPVGYEHHERISTAASVAPRRLDHPLNLFRPQMLSLAQVLVFSGGSAAGVLPLSIFSGWRPWLQTTALPSINRLPAIEYFPYRIELEGGGAISTIDILRRIKQCPVPSQSRLLAAATLGLAIAFAPAAFAADDMKKDTMTKDSMSKDKMDKDKMDKEKWTKTKWTRLAMSKDKSLKKFDEKRRYEEIKHIRACQVRPRGPCTLSADLISERRACQKRSAWSSSTGSG